MVARWHRHQHRHRTAAPPPHRRHAPDQIIQDLMLKSPTQIKSAVKLAEYMANHARTIRGIVTGILKDDGSGQPIVDDSQTTKPLFVELYSLFSKIKEDLRPQLDTTGFADMYAQTVVYGLFIARYNDTTPEDFNRFEAIGNLRQESSLLKLFFAHIATATNQHPTLDVVIGKLCELYRLADVRALLDQDEAKDTVIHFYEEFLQRYDPDLRKALGVFYTPYQVVRYMVRMVDRVL
ncbi:MAG: SAM-dependent methyltransferase, partial [Coriobacteriia bacterium]|nr:SAM-dependent methyltransferase [Coriobacteriia bacterium]